MAFRQILVVALFAAIAAGSDAATNTVTTTADSGPGSPGNVTPRPSLMSVTFDPTKNVTVVEGELGEGAPSLPLNPGSGTEMRLSFYASRAPDPSGFGEGSDSATGLGAYPLVFTGRAFRGEIPFDLRGRYLTATTSFAICFWEFGCHGRDTSEFSNAMQAK